MFILLFLAVSFLVISRINAFYRKNWSRGVDIGIRFDSDGVFEGEEAGLSENVSNRKLMPLWWGSIQYPMPGSLKPLEPGSGTAGSHRDTVSVFSYENLHRTLRFTAAKRGYYRIREAELTTEDLFFSYKYIKRYPIDTEFYVYPDILHTERFSIDFNRIVGEAIVRRHAIEDPFQLRGIRDYTPLDSLKDINWPATARTGDLKVNEYSNTSSQEVLLLLDFDGYNAYDHEKLKEDLIRAAAQLTVRLLKAGVPVGLLSNATDCVTQEEIRLPCRGGLDQNLRLLRQMARMDTGRLSRPFDELLGDKLPTGGSTHLILLSYYSEAQLQNKITELRAGGNSLRWILLREPESRALAPAIEGVTVCEVTV